MMLKFVDEWNLDPKSKAKVKRELRKWIQEFIIRSEGAVPEVHKLNFKTDEIFFFTNCQDILSKNPEAKGIEDAQRIRDRKSSIMFYLFLKQMIGDRIDIVKSKCSHCGYTEMDIQSCYDGYGYFHYCPKCKMTIVVTYPNGYLTTFSVLNALKEKLE